MNNEEKLLIGLEKLDIQPGNMVVVRLIESATVEQAKWVYNLIKSKIPDGVTACICQGDNNISTRDEAQMCDLGWVRAATASQHDELKTHNSHLQAEHDREYDLRKEAEAQRDELLAALVEVVRISDRKHDAWDRAHAAIASVKGGAS